MPTRSESYVIIGGDVDRHGRHHAVVSTSMLPDAGELSLVDELTTHVFAVDVVKPRAVATIMRWLANGRPGTSSVRVVYDRAAEAQRLIDEANGYRQAVAAAVDDLDDVLDVLAAHWSCTKFDAADRLVSALVAKDDDTENTDTEKD